MGRGFVLFTWLVALIDRFLIVSLLFLCVFAQVRAFASRFFAISPSSPANNSTKRCCNVIYRHRAVFVRQWRGICRCRPVLSAFRIRLNNNGPHHLAWQGGGGRFFAHHWLLRCPAGRGKPAIIQSSRIGEIPQCIQRRQCCHRHRSQTGLWQLGCYLSSRFVDIGNHLLDCRKPLLRTHIGAIQCRQPFKNCLCRLKPL